jgi:uncharacterized OsmC-like protein
MVRYFSHFPSRLSHLPYCLLPDDYVPDFAVDFVPVTTSRPVMKAEDLRSLQAPLKERYRNTPLAARVTLSSEGRIGAGISCKVSTGKAFVEAGLHPATGGNGLMACSGNMLLEALVACAGVTLQAVATTLGIEIREGIVRAEGDVDFRGTLAVSKDTPVGLQRVRLHFDLVTGATEDQIATLIRLTERYCVVYQTLRQSPDISISHSARNPSDAV